MWSSTDMFCWVLLFTVVYCRVLLCTVVYWCKLLRKMVYYCVLLYTFVYVVYCGVLISAALYLQCVLLRCVMLSTVVYYHALCCVLLCSGQGFVGRQKVKALPGTMKWSARVFAGPQSKYICLADCTTGGMTASIVRT